MTQVTGFSGTPDRSTLRRPGRTRVLWCIKCLGYGGAERLLVSSAAARDDEHFEYEAAYVLPSKEALVPELEALGVRVHCLGRSERNADLRWMRRLRDLLLDRPFDVVHLHLPYTAALGRLVVQSLPRSVRPRTITTEHNVWSTNPAVIRLLNWATLPFDAANVAVSPAVRDAVPSRYRERMQVVVHGVAGVDVAQRDRWRAKTRAELGVAADEVLVGTVANLRPGKGYEVLLPAARALIELDLPVRFATVGVGPLAAEVEATHRRLGLGDRFVLLGGRADALRVLAGFDVFVLASMSEGLPVSLMEALALGVPTVTSAVGGIPGVVTNGVQGLLVPPGDGEALTRALTRMVLDGAGRTRMAAAAHARGVQFDIGLATRRVEAIYHRVTLERAACRVDDVAAVPHRRCARNRSTMLEGSP